MLPLTSRLPKGQFSGMRESTQMIPEPLLTVAKISQKRKLDKWVRNDNSVRVGSRLQGLYFKHAIEQALQRPSEILLSLLQRGFMIIQWATMGMYYLTDSVTEDQKDHETQTLLIPIWQMEMKCSLSRVSLLKDNSTQNLSSSETLVQM